MHPGSVHGEERGVDEPARGATVSSPAGRCNDLFAGSDVI